MPYLFIRTKQLQWIALFLLSLCLFLLLLPPKTEQPTVSVAHAPAAVYRGEKHVALTINAHDSEKNIAKIVKVLIENEATASFFVTSSWVNKHPKTAKLLVEREFDLGVLFTDKADKDEILSEIRSVQKALSSHKKKDVFFVRAAGNLNNLSELTSLNEYITIQWSVDLKKQSPSDFIKKHQKGDIVLLDPDEDLRVTAKWISLLSKKEKLVSLSEMLGGDTDIEYIP